jgi:flagellar biosynthetic protein FlhB
MSQDDSEQNKSEQPSLFKLARAREKGTVARGMDLGFLTGLAAFTGYAWVQGAGAEGRIVQAARSALVAAPNIVTSPNEILAVTGSVLTSAVRPLAFIAGAVFLVVLVFEITQTGPVFSTESLRLDFSRLNPANGFKRVFSMRMLVETGKNILKLAVYGALAALVIREAVTTAIPVITGAQGLADALSRLAFRQMALFIAAAVVFAALDQFIVRREFLKKMRMSRREVRRESRDREGDPRLKQRRRDLHREFARLSESLRNIRGADVLITNPVHFAVALRYDPKTMAAPIIVSRGAHRFALRLRRLAFLYGVVIVQSPVLARALHRCEINMPVPEALYPPVADIYRAIGAKRAPGDRLDA